MERLAIATHQRDIAHHVAFAREYGIGIEIQVYGYNPDLLDGDWRHLVALHKEQLRGFEGEIAFHGVFYDMSSASVDPRILSITRDRYLHNLQIAAELGGKHVVFHVNYLHVIRHNAYLEDWSRRQVDFWSELGEQARAWGVLIAVENMWEPNPDVIMDVLDRVDSPWVGACLDVGHAHLYSSPDVPFSAWLERMQSRLIHCHINNNRGKYDEHLPLDAEGGIVDYCTVLPLLRALSPQPLVSLEMEKLDYMARSLEFIRQTGN